MASGKTLSPVSVYLRGPRTFPGHSKQDSSLGDHFPFRLGEEIVTCPQMRRDQGLAVKLDLASQVHLWWLENITGQ